MTILRLLLAFALIAQAGTAEVFGSSQGGTDLSGTFGTELAISLQVDGPEPPYLWRITAGTLPDGIALDDHGGLHGATGTNQACGIYNFTVAASHDPTPIPAGQLALAVDRITVMEGSAATTAVSVTVSRTGGSGGSVSVLYRTDDVSATAGSDYSACSGSLEWGDGDATDKTIVIPIAGDTQAEADESLTLTLNSPTGGATVHPYHAVVITIANDDATTSTPADPPAGGGGCNAGGVLALFGLVGFGLRRRRG